MRFTDNTDDLKTIITKCMNCGCDIEPEEFDGQGEIWCDECIEKQKQKEDESVA